MSIRIFEIDLPVFVREMPEDPLKEGPSDEFLMTVRITTGPDATAKDAVEELSRKLEHACKTTDIGDCE
jgi:hypothetical protein